MNQEEYDEIKRNVAYLKRVVCTAKPSCTSWRRGDFCLFPGELRIGRMGTCLSQSPPEDFGKIEGGLF